MGCTPDANLTGWSEQAIAVPVYKQKTNIGSILRDAIAFPTYCPII